MRMLIKFIILVTVFISESANASGWSGWLTVNEVDYHPTWRVRVVFNEQVTSECPGVTSVKWTNSDNEEFMDRVIASILLAKVTSQKVKVWVNSCDSGNGEVYVTQTQVQ